VPLRLNVLARRRCRLPKASGFIWSFLLGEPDSQSKNHSR
jgi:hypothetical protein